MAAPLTITNTHYTVPHVFNDLLMITLSKCEISTMHRMSLQTNMFNKTAYRFIMTMQDDWSH